MSLGDAAMSYCNYRLLIGGICGIIIGLCLFGGGFWLKTNKDLDTSNYLETTATVKGATVRQEEKETGTRRRKVIRVIYKLNLDLEYTVDGKVYSATSGHPTEYQTREDAEASIPSVTTVQLYYDPEKPSKYNTSKSAEDMAAGIMSSIAVVSIICGIISIMFRKNKIFCGMTIAKDAMDVFDRD